MNGLVIYQNNSLFNFLLENRHIKPAIEEKMSFHNLIFKPHVCSGAIIYFLKDRIRGDQRPLIKTERVILFLVKPRSSKPSSRNSETGAKCISRVLCGHFSFEMSSVLYSSSLFPRFPLVLLRLLKWTLEYRLA